MTPRRLTIERTKMHTNVYRIYKRCLFFWWEIAAFESGHFMPKCVKRLEAKFGKMIIKYLRK